MRDILLIWHSVPEKWVREEEMGLKPPNTVGEIPLRDAEATSPTYPPEIPLLSLGKKGFLRTVLERLGMLTQCAALLQRIQAQA